MEVVAEQNNPNSTQNATVGKMDLHKAQNSTWKAAVVRKVVGEEDLSESAVSGLWLPIFGYRCGLWVFLIDSRN